MSNLVGANNQPWHLLYKMRFDELSEAMKPFRELPVFLLGSLGKGYLFPSSDLDVIVLVNEPKRVGEFSFPLSAGPWRVRLWSKLSSFQKLPFPEAIALFSAQSLWPEHQKIIDQWRASQRTRSNYKYLLKKTQGEVLRRRTRYPRLSLSPHLKLSPGGFRDQEFIRALEFFEPRGKSTGLVLNSSAPGQDLLIGLRWHLDSTTQQSLLYPEAQVSLSSAVGASRYHEWMPDLQQHLWQVSLDLDARLNLLSSKSVSHPSNWIDRLIRSAPVPAALLLRKIFDFELASWIPDIRELRGWTQHDQYHEFTAGEHLLQCCLVWLRLVHEKKIGSGQRRILFWTCIFHDIGKGQSLPHEDYGEKRISELGHSLGLSPSEVLEVAWIVKHHLVLSELSFRRPDYSRIDFANWTSLRAQMLRTFTEIDIRGTSPLSWTSWKQQLLDQSLANIQAILQGLKPNLETVPRDILRRQKKQSGVQIFNIENTIWLNYQSATDRPGLLLGLLGIFVDLGLPVDLAVIQTTDDGWVDDWFLLPTGRSSDRLLRQIEAQLKLSTDFISHARKDLGSSKKKYKFETLFEDDRQITIAYRGKDEKGLLYSLVRQITEEGGWILRSQVNTWGSYVEDVFVIKK